MNIKNKEHHAVILVKFHSGLSVFVLAHLVLLLRSSYCQ